MLDMLPCRAIFKKQQADALTAEIIVPPGFSLPDNHVVRMREYGDMLRRQRPDVWHCFATDDVTSTHCTWRDADSIGTHLLDSVSIAVQRCTGMALRASREAEMVRVLGAEAA